ncbi:HD domain-containing protein [Candidatus Dependentiae bacterium]|nr:HD domain-containing protein [Candidatus Dependentiae bacterium]
MKVWLVTVSFVCAFLLLGYVSYPTTTHIVMKPLLQRLLQDMQLYKLDAAGDPLLHAGDLYEHSIWTYNGMIALLRGNLPYVRNVQLTERQKEVVALAALLHDIGKAGRLDLLQGTHPVLRRYDIHRNAGIITHITYYQDNQQHTRICFEYAAKPFLTVQSGYDLRDYYRASGNHFVPFAMEQMFQELGLTPEEQQVIAILVGIHYEFGNLNRNKITNDGFLTKLEKLVKAVHYNGGELNEFIVRLAILIQVADVKGLVPVPAYKTPLFPEGISCNPVHEPVRFSDPFTEFNYVSHDCCSAEPIGVQKMEELLACFHARQQRNVPLGEYVLA